MENDFYFLFFCRIHRSGKKDALYKSNLLLRGCTVRNTEEAVGIVIYAGKTIQMNKIKEYSM